MKLIMGGQSRVRRRRVAVAAACAAVIASIGLVLPISASATGAATVTGTPPAGVVGQAMSYSFSTTNGAGCSITSGFVPDGLSLSSGCVLTGTPTWQGRYSYTVTEAGSGGAASGTDAVTQSIAAAPSASVASCTQPGNPGFSSTYWSPYNDFTPTQMDTNLAAQNAVNERNVIIGWAADADTGANDAAYPASPSLGYGAFNPDFIPNLLTETGKYHDSVWMGLIVSPTDNALAVNYTSPTYLAALATKFERLADDLYSKYGSSITGWYNPLEPGQANVATPALATQYGQWLATIDQYLHTHDGDKPVMIATTMQTDNVAPAPASFVSEIAPMMQYAQMDVWNVEDDYGQGSWTPAQEESAYVALASQAAGDNSTVWATIWTPQKDSNGVHLPVSQVEPYLRALGTSSGGAGLPLSEYTFPSYFNSDPTVTSGRDATYDNSLAAADYASYRAYCMQPVHPPTAVTALGQSASTVLLTWTAASDGTNDPVTGYTISRAASASGPWVALGTTGRVSSFVDTAVQPSASYYYQVVAQDQSGTESTPAVSATAATTDPLTPAPAHAPYTMSTSSSSDNSTSYPDTSTPTKLTDGVLGSPVNYGDGHWRGVNVTDGGTVTWTIDLGSVQSVWYLNSRWLYNPDSGIFLPSKVTYSLSSSSTFTPAASVSTTTVSHSGNAASGVDDQVVDYNEYLASGTTARYIRVTAYDPYVSWLFTDEIGLN